MVKKILGVLFFLLYFLPCLAMQSSFSVHNGTDYELQVSGDTQLFINLRSIHLSPVSDAMVLKLDFLDGLITETSMSGIPEAELGSEFIHGDIKISIRRSDRKLLLRLTRDI